MSNFGAGPMVRNGLAKAVNRLTERFFPPVSGAFNNPGTIVKVVPTLLGTLIWDIAAFIYVARDIGLSMIEVFSLASPENIFVLITFLVMVDLMFAILIATSFDRGRPLNFFFRGVIFPTATLVILGYAFPS